MYEFDLIMKSFARFFRFLLIITAMVDGHSRCSIFWNIMFLVVAKVTCMEPRALHSTSEMDSIISILPSSLLFCSWGLYHLQERNMLQIYWWLSLLFISGWLSCLCRHTKKKGKHDFAIQAIDQLKTWTCNIIFFFFGTIYLFMKIVQRLEMLILFAFEPSI